MPQAATEVTLEEAVKRLLAEHEVEANRYQTYNTAERAAWKNWEAFKKDETPQGRAWRAVAEEIGAQYHAPKWLAPTQ